MPVIDGFFFFFIYLQLLVGRSIKYLKRYVLCIYDITYLNPYDQVIYVWFRRIKLNNYEDRKKMKVNRLLRKIRNSSHKHIPPTASHRRLRSDRSVGGRGDRSSAITSGDHEILPPEVNQSVRIHARSADVRSARYTDALQQLLRTKWSPVVPFEKSA